MQAWDSLQEPAELTIVGEGEWGSAVERWARGRQACHVLGHLDRDALADAYAHADVLVLPARSDPWGLVINEAMASGLPVIATRAPGAVDDLLNGTGAGLVVPSHDPRALTQAMRRLAVDVSLRLEMGSRATRVISGYTPEAWAEGVEEAIHATVTGLDRQLRG
jgi:glycosyltransferase involved in cell wall biosynthesis